MNDINLLYVAIDGAAITVVVLLAIRLVSQTANLQLAFLFTWICLSVAANVVTSRDDYELLIDPGYRLDLGELHGLFNLFRNSSAGAFMLVCHIVFRDSNHMPRLWLGLWVLQIFLEEPIAWILGTGWSPLLESVLYEVVPALLQLAFIATALYWMASTRDDDLIISRRTARLLVIAIFTAQALFSLLVERIAFEFGWVPYSWQYPIHVAVVALGVMLNVVLLFAASSPNAALVLGPSSKPASPTVSPEALEQDDADTTQIRTALEEEQIYRTPGLTVHGLASHLGIPEYRLRNLVHEQLGFRNFNALLHHYRIEEVSAALRDRSQNNIPILTLALSAGYQSINPFNRAFRERFSMTPTEYRKQNQVDS